MWIPAEILEKVEDWLWHLRVSRNMRGNRIFMKEWGPLLDTLAPWQRTIFMEQHKNNIMVGNRQSALMAWAFWVSGIVFGYMLALLGINPFAVVH